MPKLKKLSLNELQVQSFPTTLSTKAGGPNDDSNLTSYSSTKDYHPECSEHIGCHTKTPNGTGCILIH